MYKFYVWDNETLAYKAVKGFPVFFPKSPTNEWFIYRRTRSEYRIAHLTSGLLGCSGISLTNAWKTHSTILPFGNSQDSTIKSHIAQRGISPFIPGEVWIDKCEKCGNTDELRSFEIVKYCDDCFDEEVISCYLCDIETLSDNSQLIDDERYCETCSDERFFSCSRCDELTSNDNSFSVRNNGLYCQSCWEDNTFHCEGCGDTYNTEACGGNDMCDNCYSDDDESSSHIKNYSTNVLNYLNADKGRQLFGVELEVATKESLSVAADDVHSLVCNDAILKEDGSIASGEFKGFEVVTRPMLFDNQVKFWNNFIDHVPSDLRSYDVGTCGLHVHVTKSSVSQLTLGKLLVFVNDERNKPLIKKIAQRYNCGYSSAKEKTFTDAKFTNSDRYEFINTKPENTIEFRLFRGTLNRTRLIACIEFVKTLIAFCDQTSMQALSTDDFTKFVKKESKLKNLKTILNLELDNSVENQIAVAAAA